MVKTPKKTKNRKGEDPEDPIIKVGDLVEIVNLLGYEGRVGVVLAEYKAPASDWDLDTLKTYVDVVFTDGEEITFFAFYLNVISAVGSKE